VFIELSQKKPSRFFHRLHPRFDSPKFCRLQVGSGIQTDPPFKLDEHRIIVVKGMPVDQCGSCGEYVLLDMTMERVDRLIASMDKGVELEVRRYGAAAA
jgi:YgiT-type zinc finger domain-containing protein